MMMMMKFVWYSILLSSPRHRQVESLMTAEDAGKDLASVQDLMKKHDLVENDIAAHEDRVNDMNQQVRAGRLIWNVPYMGYSRPGCMFFMCDVSLSQNNM